VTLPAVAVAVASALAAVALTAVLAGMAGARGAAMTAADAAALAAVGAAPLVGGSGDACAEASVVVAANGARLERCSAPPGGWSLGVEVEVSAPLGRLAGPLRARAAAAAVLRPAGGVQPRQGSARWADRSHAPSR
jgi:hypothetical protein